MRSCYEGFSGQLGQGAEEKMDEGVLYIRRSHFFFCNALYSWLEKAAVDFS